MVQEYMEQNQLLGTSPDPAFAAMQGQGEANTYTYGQSAGELGQLSRIDNPEASGPGESYGQYGQNDQYDQSGQPGELGQMAPGYQGQPDEAGEYEDLRTSGDGNMERQTGNSGILHAAPARNQWSPEQAGPGKRGQDNDGYEAWERERQSFELWAYSEKRDLQEKWDHTQVVEAAAKLTEHNEELELKFRLDGIAIKGNLADYGNSIHIARHNGRYVVLIEGDQFQFDKGVSPIELLKPEGLDQVIKRLGEKADDGLPY
ncbi:DUF3898 domain-containing protein [Paenibacillus eucommiae]|nr:DUF3898 domain-containing protein [Paenibacillus eucommiae]